MLRAILMDVDGVLTDGKLYLDDRGRDFKRFDTKDGFGIRMALEAGLKVAWISGRTSGATLARARELGVTAVRQGVSDKAAEAASLLRRWKLKPGEAAACGDDVPDLGLFSAAGFTACPADAVPAVRKKADLVLAARGGDGAVREFIEEVLRRNQKPRKSKERTTGMKNIVISLFLALSVAAAAPLRADEAADARKDVDAGNAAKVSTGHYLEIWKKEASGHWKMFRDIGLPD